MASQKKKKREMEEGRRGEEGMDELPVTMPGRTSSTGRPRSAMIRMRYSAIHFDIT